MKAQTKALLASIVVIALALTAVSGVTYSWFSDTEKAEINVSTGKVDISMEITSLKDETLNRSESTDLNSQYAFGLNAYAKFTQASEGNANLQLSNLADGDSIRINFLLKNNSTVDTIYRVSSMLSGVLSEYIVSEVTIGSDTTKDSTDWISAHRYATPGEELAKGSVTISFNSEGNANGSSDGASITLKVEAYQANTPSSDLPGLTFSKTVEANESISKTFDNGNAGVGSLGVSIPSAVSAGIYSIASLGSLEGKSYSIVVDGKDKFVVAGMSVSAKDSSGNTIDLKEQLATLTFVLDQKYVDDSKGLADDYSLVHQKSDGAIDTVNLKKASGTLSNTGEFTLTKNNDGTYTLEVYVKGFSSYMMLTDPVASVGSKFYDTVQNAIDDAVSGQTVKVLTDIDLGSTVVVSGKIIILDMNGKRFYNTSEIWVEEQNKWSLVSVRDAGTLTIKGDGAFDALENDCYCVDVQDGSTCTIENGEFVGNIHAAYVQKGILNVNGGFYSVQQKYPDAAKADEFVLNCFDANFKNGTAKIFVTGGRFSNFNPGNCMAEGADTNFLAEGYSMTSSTAKVDEKDVTYYFVTTSEGNDDIVLPKGVTENNFESNTVYDGTSYYATMDAALKAIHKKDIQTLWCKPNADLGAMTHGHVCQDLTVYGNHAYISGGEREFEFDTYRTPHGGDSGSDLTSDVTMKVYSLDQSGAWGQRNSDKKIALEFYNCKDMGRIYFSGTSGAIDISVKNCSFGVQTETAFHTNAPGIISISDTLFEGYAVAVNLSNKSSATQTISISDCIFVDNALSGNKSDWDSFKAPVRIVASGIGSSSVLKTENCVFIYSEEGPVYGNYRFGDSRPGESINGTVTWNGQTIQQDKPASN